MPELECVVCATDFSAGARAAAHRAALAACELGIPRAILMHVLRAGLPAAVEEPVMRGVRNALAALADELAVAHGVSMQPIVTAGSVHERLGEAMTDRTLFVAGARGLHPLRDLALGSTAERLVRKASGPILVVKRPPEGPYRRVLVAVDFSAPSRAAARLAAAVAPQARLELVHAYEVEFESTLRFADLPEETVQSYRNAARTEVEREMQKLIAELALPEERLSSRLGLGYAPSVLDEAERRLGADLMVLGKHGKSALEELLLGSVALHALQSTGCDVLVVGGA